MNEKIVFSYSDERCNRTRLHASRNNSAERRYKRRYRKPILLLSSMRTYKQNIIYIRLPRYGVLYQLNIIREDCFVRVGRVELEFSIHFYLKLLLFLTLDSNLYLGIYKHINIYNNKI